MKLTQKRRGKVVLECSREEFAIILLDAAKSTTGVCEPLRGEIIRLAAEFSQHEAVHCPHSSNVYLLRDVKRAMGEPLLSDDVVDD